MIARTETSDLASMRAACNLIVTMDLVQLNDPGQKKTPPRLREDLRQRHPRATAATEFHAALDALGITQRRAAKLFNVTPRHIRRWRSGTRRAPHALGMVCNLLTTGAVTIEQVEAAAPISARTNGSGKSGPPASLFVEPASEQSASLANPGSTTAEKVWALKPATCRWPHGDPRHSD